MRKLLLLAVIMFSLISSIVLVESQLIVGQGRRGGVILGQTETSSSNGSGGSVNLNETDPRWTANFTNMQDDCPAGNYSYGVQNNGTLLCRSDNSGGSGTFDNTNIAYLNNTQNFTRANRFNINVTLGDCLIWVGALPMYVCSDNSANVFIRGLGVQLLTDLPRIGTNSNTAVSLTFDVSGGGDGFINFNNGTFSSLGFDNFETDERWFFQKSINVSQNVTATYYFGNGSYLTNVCKANGTDCPSVTSFDNTNIAYLNNTQTFTGINTFNNLTRFNHNVTFDQNINSSDSRVNIQFGNNITWDDPNCGIGSSLVQSLVVKCNAIVEFQAIVLNLRTTIGTASALNFLTPAGTSAITFSNATSLQHFQFPVPISVKTLYGTSTPSSLTFNRLYNITWWGNDNRNLGIHSNHTQITGHLNVSGNLSGTYLNANATRTWCLPTQIMMGDGRCVENNTATGSMENNASAYFSITTEANSSSSGTKINVFGNSSYMGGGYKYTNNSNASSFIYNANGNITFMQTKLYYIDVSLLYEMDGDDGLVTIMQNGNKIYEHNIFLPASDLTCNNEGTVSIPLIKRFSAGDNVSIYFEQGSTSCIDSGATATNGTSISIFQIG